MTDALHPPSGPTRVFAFLGAAACFLLGAFALYSSGVGLIDPKFHRAAGFALALIAGVVAARKAREAKGPLASGAQLWHLCLDVVMIVAGLWSIWSFHFVQTKMETALYDVSTADAWPALAGLIVFLELCRRLWGWGLFGVCTFGER